MKKLILGATLILSCGIFSGTAKNVLDLKYSIEDSAIVYPESFESDSQKLLENWYLKNYTSLDDNFTSTNDPGASEELIKKRLAALPTVIDMPCNQIVVSYIERYTKKGRPQLSALLGLSTYYMPIFEQALEEHGLPLELKYLPVIESALDPNAVSKHGAAGLWQFIVSAAKGYDMEVTSLVDERRDPYISSNRACRFLRDLYNTYGDWSLAIAAYNCGPGTVNKALHRAGGDTSNHDFWSIYYYLPQETRGYVPLFIAANYVMNYYPEHNISPVLPTKPLITDTIHVTKRVNLNQISEVLDIPIEEVRLLNPQFRADVIPGTGDHPYNLILPSQQIHAYIISEDEILNYEAEKYARKTEATPGGEPEYVDLADNSNEPFNPADLAPAEEAAAESLVAMEQNTTTPTNSRRRRHNDQASRPEQTSAPVAEKPLAAVTPATPKEKAKEVTKAKEATKAKETTTKSTTATTKKATKPETSAQKSKTKKAEKAKDNKKQTKKAKEPAKPKDHTVVSGENLSTIAKKNGVSVEDLKKANPKLKDPNKLQPGDKLNLPKTSGTKKK